MSQVANSVSQARIELVEQILMESDWYPLEPVSSLEWCSAHHLNALLDNQLSPAEALRTRNALGFDEQLSHRLEQLALVDTLVVSHVVESDVAPFHNPLHTNAEQRSAYLH